MNCQSKTAPILSDSGGFSEIQPLHRVGKTAKFTFLPQQAVGL